MENIQINGLAHIGLYVNDIQKSLEFYQDKLDFQLIHETRNKAPEGDYLVKFIQNGACMIELVQPPNILNREDGWFDHITLAVKNLDNIMQQLESDGVQFEKESYTVAPHVFPPKGSKWVFFRGPDGEHIELNERL